VAIALARDGYTVVVAGRRQEGLDGTVRMAPTGAPPLVAIPTDVRSEVSVKALFARVRQGLGRLDLLINNAGVGAPTKPLEDLTLDQWQTVIETNLTGAFLCTREAIKLMKSQNPSGGRIINNGSISAYSPRPRSAPYTAAKHAITGLTKSTSLDCRHLKIACGQIDIGNANTEMTEQLAKGAIQADGTIKPEPRIDVEDVARAVLYMASLPLSANVQFMTVMATTMPFVGRG